MKSLRCMVCGANNVDVKNLGFVHSDWKYQGILKSTLTNVSGEGKTFDDKMHTFKETELESVFLNLEIAVNKNFPKDIIDTFLYTTQINDTEEDCDVVEDFECDVDEFSLMSSRAKNNNFGKCKTSIVRHNK